MEIPLGLSVKKQTNERKKVGKSLHLLTADADSSH